MKFILMGRSRSGTTITHDILNKYGLNITNQSNRYMDSGFEGGDKVATINPTKFDKVKIIHPDMKYIYIYRDGRDCVCSGIAKGKSKGENEGWKSLDPWKNSKNWAYHFWKWDYIKLQTDNWVELRFEDYIEHPGVNAFRLADFLNLDLAKMEGLEKKLIDLDKTHRGRWEKELPDWRSCFHPQAYELLKMKGYL